MSLNTILATAPLTTANYILKATGTTIGNSLIWDNGTNVGIGNTNTSYTLDVSGTLRNTTSAYFGTTSGNIGLGTTTIDTSGGLYTCVTVDSATYSRYSLQSSGVAKGRFQYDATNVSLGSQTTGGKLQLFTSAAYNMEFLTNDTLRMTITSAGNVGIGTSSPKGRFDVFRAAGDSGTAAIVISSGESPSRNWGLNTDVVEAGDFAICVSTTTGGTPTPTGTNVKLRILSDGTLLIGGASSSGAYNCSLGSATANTYYQVRSTNTNSLYGADTRGTWMGNLSSQQAYINCPSFVPGVDNSTSCGSSSYRWTAVYAVNGSIQTSDERQKTNIQNSDLGLDFINKLNPVSYKWIVGGNDAEYNSIEDENGKLSPLVTSTPVAGIRTHYGLIAQQVKEVLGNKDFGGFVHDKETDMMSLRYDQFISPLIKAIQELNERLNKAGL